MFWMVLFMILMVIWLVYGVGTWDRAANQYGLAGTLIPWACVAILGAFIFGGLDWPHQPHPRGPVLR